MAFEVKPITYKEFIDKIKKYNPNADFELIEKAYKFAEEVHRGQKRCSGEDYLVHPVEVARLLIDLKADSATICAALLHDTIEDTNVSLETLKKEFGQEIATLVDGLTKILGEMFETKEEYKAENLRKLLLAATTDVRVILIRLADRLHNMRTLSTLREEKRKRIAQETMDIYAPIAHKLGMWRIKGELEDLSFRYLNFQEYVKLKEKITEKRAEREKATKDTVRQIKEDLKENSIITEVSGRAKYFYSIYKKMQQKKKTFDQIYDLIAIRIITKTIPDCYKALEIVHTKYTPRLDRFKDFIEHPKANGYQSIHTAVMCGKKMIEVQIRTREMHDLSEEGITAKWEPKRYKNVAHWKYKGIEKDDYRFDRMLMWVKQILDWKNKSKNAIEFVETLKIDLFENEIITLTPKGDPISLPDGATAVDFAYAVHSGVGNRCSKVKVNNKLMTLDHILHSGDVVEIITQNNAKPSRNWLNFVKTSKAKSKIRAAVGIEKEHKPKEANRRMEAKKIKSTMPENIHIKGKKALLKFSKCCEPKQGEEIIGFYTKDNKITVHKTSCINIHTLDENKKVQLSWVMPEDMKLEKIKVIIKERPRVLADLLNLFAMEKINVRSVNTRIRKKRIILTLKVMPKEAAADFKSLCEKIKKISGVTDVDVIN